MPRQSHDAVRRSARRPRIFPVLVLIATLVVTACSAPTPATQAPATAAPATAAPATAAPATAAPATAAPATAAPATAAPATPAPTAAPTPAPLTGRAATLVVGREMRPNDTFDPARAYQELYVVVLGNVYERLVKFAETPDGVDESRFEGELAESWTVSDDGTTYTFKLDPAARFASGSPVTAEDVRWSYQRFINIKGSPGFLTGSITSISAPDPATVVIELKAPDSTFLGFLTQPNYGVLEAAVVKQHGGTDAADADTTDTADAWLNENSAGSGPYAIAEQELTVKTVLQRVEDYWGGPPAAIEQVVFTNVPDSEAQASALQRGDIDITWSVSPDVRDRLASAGFGVATGPTIQWFFTAMTTDPEVDPIVANPKVRQAMKYATDWNGLMQLCADSSERIAGLAPEGYGGLKIADGLQEDLDKARALLTEAGYPNGFEGPTITTFQIGAGASCPSWGDIAVKLAADWGRVGMTVKVDIQDVGVFFGPAFEGKYAIIVLDWFNEYHDPIVYAKALLPGNVNTDTIARWSEKDPGWTEIKALTDQMLAEPDREKQLALFRQLEPLVIEHGPVTPISIIEQWYMYNSNITGMFFHPIFRFDLYRLGRSQ